MIFPRLLPIALIALTLSACDGAGGNGPDAIQSDLPARETPPELENRTEPPFSTPPPPIGRQIPVYSADSVTFQIRESFPVQLEIKARGTVRSGGWSKPELRLNPVMGPAGDSLSFTLVALPPNPDAMVTQALVPVEATYTVQALAPAVKTIRIIAETNVLEEKLP